MWPPDEVLSLRKSIFFHFGLKNMNGTYDLWYHNSFYNPPDVFFLDFFAPRVISTILCLNLLITSPFRTRRFVSMFIDSWRVRWYITRSVMWLVRFMRRDSYCFNFVRDFFFSVLKYDLILKCYNYKMLKFSVSRSLIKVLSKTFWLLLTQVKNISVNYGSS